MNLSIVVPQIFYDLYARVLPGLIFLLVLSLGFPELNMYIGAHGSTGINNLVDSLGQGFGYAALSYFFGWLFSAFTLASKRKAIHNIYSKKDDPKTLNAKYQWIRLSNSEAGFRIVKLRAEARMFEATRTAMFAIIIFSAAYLLLFPLLDLIEQVSWTKGITIIVLALIAAIGFRKCEIKAWDYYWGNVCIIYDILHDKKDPVIDLKGSDDKRES